MTSRSIPLRDIKVKRKSVVGSDLCMTEDTFATRNLRKMGSAIGNYPVTVCCSACLLWTIVVILCLSLVLLNPDEGVTTKLPFDLQWSQSGTVLEKQIKLTHYYKDEKYTHPYLSEPGG